MRDPNAQRRSSLLWKGVEKKIEVLASCRDANAQISDRNDARSKELVVVPDEDDYSVRGGTVTTNRF